MIKRKFIYIALIILLLLTGCNQARNKIVVNSSSNNTEKSDMIKQLESNHFKFYSKEQDRDCINDLSDELEDNYTRIINDLHTSLNKKVDIYIFSDLNSYHKAINQPNAPSWVVGNAVSGSNTIQMVNPSNADGRPYSDFMQVIVHEFTHVCISNMNSNANSIPIWLNEGVALFEAKQVNGNEQVFSNAKSANKFPTLKDLETDPYTFGNSSGYQFSYSIVDYIVKNYGYDKLVTLIKSPSNFEKILGVSKEDFQKKWIDNFN
jgi:hypothetical protein